MSDAPQIRVLSIDDHPLVREGIATILGTQRDMILVGQAANGREGIVKYRQYLPDVTLMDLRLPDVSGIDALIAIRTQFVNARIIMLSTSQGDVEIRRALEAGARGFLLKTLPPKEIVAAIREVHAGRMCVPAEVAAHLAETFAENALTAREAEILQLIASGKRNRDVAEILSITEHTVKVHMRHVLEKLDAGDRTEAIMIAIRRGIIYP